MSTFLFDKIVFGPVHSRRLGSSLGINLLPTNKKICSFNCIYCECGWTKHFALDAIEWYEVSTIRSALENKLLSLKEQAVDIDAITFAGNGEPTLHPSFLPIIKETIALRSQYYPTTKVTVLSNATTLHQKDIQDALMLIDLPILKLDAGNDEMYRLINKPMLDVSIDNIVEQLKRLKFDFIIQSLFLKGTVDGKEIDNTTIEHITQWLSHISSIKPNKVMIYTIARGTPAIHLKKTENEKLQYIAKEVEKLGIKAEVYL